MEFQILVYIIYIIGSYISNTKGALHYHVLTYAIIKLFYIEIESCNTYR